MQYTDDIFQNVHLKHIILLMNVKAIFLKRIEISKRKNVKQKNLITWLKAGHTAQVAESQFKWGREKYH